MLIHSRLPVWRDGFAGQGLGLQSDVDGVVGGVAEVFDFVLKRRVPSGLAGLGEDFFYLSVFVGEAEVSGGKNHDDSAGMVMEAGLLVRAIVDVDDLHPFILECQLVMLGFDFGGILSQD